MTTERAGYLQMLAVADTDRATGRGDDAARLYYTAASLAGAAGDLAAGARAALGAASVQAFDTEPGRLPALLHGIMVRSTDDTVRSRLAAALARCWVYAGQAERGAPFADEALDRARRTGDEHLLVDALDAALATHWGPDDIGRRRVLVRQLDENAAHLADPDARLQAHLWGLHVACEALDVQSMNRQMRAIELLGEESARALFFAASRRHMLDLLGGRTDTTARLRSVAAGAASRSSIPDAAIVLQAMDAYAAVHAADTARIAAGAQAAEDFARAEGVITVSAEAAFLWSEAARPEKARALLATFDGGVLEGLPRDVNWLLVMQCLLEVALALRERDTIERSPASWLPTPAAPS